MAPSSANIKKTVFLTGSASGLGLHLTQCFLDQGYHVVATDINLQAIRNEAKERDWASGKLLSIKLDVSKAKQWQAAWDKALETFGQVDIVLNVAGYLKPGRVAETEWEEIDRHLDINVKGVIFGSKLAAQSMLKRGGGHIINIASLAGIAPIPGISLYSTSKFAVRGFSLALAQELKGSGVAVTVVCPDAIETPMLTLQEDYDEAALTFSGGKVLTVDDLSDVIFKQVLIDRPIETVVPLVRGVLAKTAGSVPQVATVLSEHLNKIGRKKQSARKQGHKEVKSGV